nr:MAG TPA: hypothetical protein [Caudoviricetes sp.]
MLCTLKIEPPHIFPRNAGEILHLAYQGHAGKMERNI